MILIHPFIFSKIRCVCPGILCVTKDNLNSSWLNFEAGALSKSIEQSKVCPFLVDLRPSDVTNSPILQFQMANATREDVFKLFQSININLENSKLSDDVLSTTFETFWPKIEEALKVASSVSSLTQDVAPGTKKSSKDIQAPIEEILELMRYQHKLLNSPEELLPAEYLLKILRGTERKLIRGHTLEVLPEIWRILQIVYSMTGEILAGCEISESRGVPLGESQFSIYKNKVSRIREYTRELIILFKKYDIPF